MVVNIQLDFRLCSKRLSYRIYSMVPGLSPVTILLTPITGYLKKAFIYLFATVTRHIYPRERTNVYSLCSLDILIILSACHLAQKNPTFSIHNRIVIPIRHEGLDIWITFLDKCEWNGERTTKSICLPILYRHWYFSKRPTHFAIMFANGSGEPPEIATCIQLSVY